MTVRQALAVGWPLAIQASKESGVDLRGPLCLKGKVPDPALKRKRTHCLTVKCLACGKDIPVHEQQEHLAVCG